jgi:beta-N-acetylhexosaminidase
MRTKIFTILILLSAAIVFIYGDTFLINKDNSNAGKSVSSSLSLRSQGNEGVDIFSKKNDPWVEGQLAGMSLEEKAAQMIFPYAYGDYMSDDSPEFYRMEKMVEDYHVGGFAFLVSNIYSEAVAINKLQHLSKIPLLIADDFEWGVAMRIKGSTEFPHNMALGAANDSEATYQMGKIIGEEGRAIGVEQDYGPVSDVNTNANNPIINVRSFSDNDALVERLSAAYLKGVQDGGMIATAKHFPGHGSTSIDSHRALPIISEDKSELDKVELPPFQNDINNGVMSVMIGHLDVPALEEQNNLPATLSNNIVTGLLKDQMGFKGLIVTDAIRMQAVAQNYTTAQAAVMAVKAGNDVVLFPDDVQEAIYAIINAVKKGEITEQRLDESVRKILLAKKWSGLDKDRYSNIEDISKVVGTKAHWDVANKLARESITLVKDKKDLIPLSSDPDINYAAIDLLDSRTSDDDDYFNRQFKQNVSSLTVKDIYPDSDPEEYNDALRAARHANYILINVYLNVRAYSGNIGLEKQQKRFIKRIFSLRKPVVLISHGNPYILSDFSRAGTYLCDYDDAKVSEKALVEALFGQSKITAKLPITIPNTKAKFGDGIEKDKTALRNISQQNSPYEDKKFVKVDSIINTAVQDSAFPGAVLLVAQNGKILYEKAYGHFTYSDTVGPVQLNTMYDLASLTKVIATTTATMICYDRGLFKLDDKVAKYLPKFGRNGKENVTIRNLLVHDSGLRPDVNYHDFTNLKNPKPAIFNAIYNDSLVYPTGTKMVYSDLNFITMAKIIETITHKPLNVFTKENIFDPMGMTSTMFNPPSSLRSRIAPTEHDTTWRHRQVWGTVHDETSALLGGVAGHAGLFSDAGDLAKLLQMLLQKGEYQGRRYIKASTVEMFIKKQSDLSSRALGWDTKSPAPNYSSAGHYFSDLSYGHTGFTGTEVWTDPTKNLFAIFLTNRVFPTRKNEKIRYVRPAVYDAVYQAVVGDDK